MEGFDREALECPICWEVFSNAMETFCGHAFCEYCLAKCIEKEQLCPICRKNPTPIHPSFTLRRIVQQFEKLSGENQTKEVDLEKEKKVGNLCYQKGHYAEALKHYSNAIDKYPAAVLFANRAACYFKLQQYQLAEADCDTAIQMDPDYVKAYIRKANCLENLSQSKLALLVLQEARNRDKSGQFFHQIEDAIKRLNPNSTPSTPQPNLPPNPPPNNPPPPSFPYGYPYPPQGSSYPPYGYVQRPPPPPRTSTPPQQPFHSNSPSQRNRSSSREGCIQQ